MNFIKNLLLIFSGLLSFCFYSQLPKNKLIDTVLIEIERPAENILKYNNSKQYTGGSLADVISSQAGIGIVQSGANTSKPIIEGLRNNRILVITDGVRLSGQDWSDQHTTEVDMSAFRNIKIIKGAKSVRYGAGALGGVILLEPKSLSFTDNFRGNISLSGSSNDGRTLLNSFLQGSFKNKWAWQVQQSYQRSGDYKTSDYYVNNTGLKQNNIYIALGYKSNTLKAKLSASRFTLENGVFYGSLNGNIEDFKDKILLGQPPEINPASYNIKPPKQNVEHLILKSEFDVKLNNQHTVELNYNIQKNIRKEFDIRRLDKTSVPTQDMRLVSHSLEGIWHYDIDENFHTKVGLQYLYQNNYNIPGTGVAPTIPNYKLNNYASFVISEYQRPKWRASIGLRYDHRTTNALGYDWLGQLYGSKRNFSNISYNAVFNYHISNHWHYLIDFGMAWRSPEPYELYVNGKQHGIPIYYIGDKDLDSERGMKISNKLEYRTPSFGFVISGFVQPIKNYIYQIPGQRYLYLFSGPTAVFKTLQTDAFFRGGDLSLDWKPTNRISYTANTAIVFANNSKTNGYLPIIPPFSLYQNIKWDIPSSVLNKFYILLEHKYFAKQKRFDPSLDLIPDTPDAYHLFGAQIGAELYYNRRNTCAFMLKIDNLTNQLYKNYTDHFRYFVHGKGLDIQLKTTINF